MLLISSGYTIKTECGKIYPDMKGNRTGTVGRQTGDNGIGK
jgi:hypothetical protein